MYGTDISKQFSPYDEAVWEAIAVWGYWQQNGVLVIPEHPSPPPYWDVLVRAVRCLELDGAVIRLKATLESLAIFEALDGFMTLVIPQCLHWTKIENGKRTEGVMDCRTFPKYP